MSDDLRSQSSAFEEHVEAIAFAIAAHRNLVPFLPLRAFKSTLHLALFRGFARHVSRGPCNSV